MHIVGSGGVPDQEKGRILSSDAPRRSPLVAERINSGGTGHFVPKESTGLYGEPGYDYYIGTSVVAALTASGAYFDASDGTTGTVWGYSFLGSDSRPEGADPRPARFNFFYGSNPAGWLSNVPAYGSVIYRDLWPGIDLTYYGTPAGLKYEFTLAPGADPDLIRLATVGVDDLEVSGQDLILHTTLGEMRDSGLVAYVAETGDEVGVQFAISSGIVTFNVLDEYEGTLVIDPLVYSSLLGTDGSDNGRDIAIGADGCVYVTTATDDDAFPTTTGAYAEVHQGTWDATVSKFSPDLTTLLYSTYLGGGGADSPYALAVDGAGYAYVVGYTASDPFPVTAGAYDVAAGGGNDGFLSILSPDGSSLNYSTYIGAGGDDRAYGVALYGGDVYVTGQVGTGGVNTTGVTPYNGTFGGGVDAFLTVIHPGNRHCDEVYATYLGGIQDDIGHGVAVNSTGYVYLGGHTKSGDFPTNNSYDDTHNSVDAQYDAYMSVIDITAGVHGLLYSTFLGGANQDECRDLDIDGAGNVYLTGFTKSADLPLGTQQYTKWHADDGGTDDAYLLALHPSATLHYSAFLGAVGNDQAVAVETASQSGVVVLGGYTSSASFPIVDGNSTLGGGEDAWVACLNTTANGTGSLAYSTLHGGTGVDHLEGIDLYANDTILYAGVCGAGAFQTTAGAYDETTNGGNDAFFAYDSFELINPNINGETDTGPLDLGETLVIDCNATDAGSGLSWVNVTFAGVDFVMINTCGTGYSWSGLMNASGVQTYTFTAGDAVGNTNISGPHTVEVGDVPNITAVSAPSSLDLSETFTLSCFATDNRSGDSGISWVNVTFNGVNYTMSNASTPEFSNWTWSLAMTVGGGSLTYQIHAGDVAGNVNSSASYTVDVGDLPNLTAPTADSVIYTGANFTVSLSVTDGLTGDTGLLWVRLILEINGVNYTYSMTNSGATWSWSGALTTLGDHRFLVNASDVAGNTNCSDLGLFSVVTPGRWHPGREPVPVYPPGRKPHPPPAEEPVEVSRWDQFVWDHGWYLFASVLALGAFIASLLGALYLAEQHAKLANALCIATGAPFIFIALGWAFAPWLLTDVLDAIVFVPTKIGYWISHPNEFWRALWPY